MTAAWKRATLLLAVTSASLGGAYARTVEPFLSSPSQRSNERPGRPFADEAPPTLPEHIRIAQLFESDADWRAERKRRSELSRQQAIEARIQRDQEAQQIRIRQELENADRDRIARIAEQKRLDEQRRKDEEAQHLAELKRVENERRVAEEARMAEQRRKDEEAQRLAEQIRIEDERKLTAQRLAEQKRLEDERKLTEQQRRKDEEAQRLAEQKRIEDERKVAEQRRKDEEAQRLAEQKRLEEERKVAEQKRLEDERKLAAQRRKDEEAQRLAEQKRIEDERKVAEQRRKDEEAQRLAEQKRIEDERKVAEQRRKDEEAQRLAEQKRIEGERKVAEQRLAEAKPVPSPSPPIEVPGVSGLISDEVARFTVEQRRLARERLERERLGSRSGIDDGTGEQSQALPDAQNANPTRLAAIPPQAEPSALPPPVTPPSLSQGDIRLAQVELKRLGCYNGPADGRLTADTLAGLDTAERSLPDAASRPLRPLSSEALEFLKTQKEKVCTGRVACEPNQTKQGTTCIAALPPASQEPTPRQRSRAADDEEDTPARRQAPRQAAPAAPAAPRPAPSAPRPAPAAPAGPKPVINLTM